MKGRFFMAKRRDYSDINYFSNGPIFDIADNSFTMKSVYDFYNILKENRNNLDLIRFFSELIKNINGYVRDEKNNVDMFAVVITGKFTNYNNIGFNYLLYTDDRKNGIKKEMTKVNGLTAFYLDEHRKDEKEFSINLINFGYDSACETCDIDNIEFLKTSGIEVINSIIQYLEDCLEAKCLLVNDPNDIYDDED